jgi:hypothetical protein
MYCAWPVQLKPIHLKIIKFICGKKQKLSVVFRNLHVAWRNVSEESSSIYSDSSISAEGGRPDSSCHWSELTSRTKKLFVVPEETNHLIRISYSKVYLNRTI